MTTIENNMPAPSKGDYEAPRLTLIGSAAEVILGFAGAGDDYLGYSVPEFEFAEDSHDEHSR